MSGKARIDQLLDFLGDVTTKYPKTWRWYSDEGTYRFEGPGGIQLSIPQDLGHDRLDRQMSRLWSKEFARQDRSQASSSTKGSKSKKKGSA